MDGGQRLAMMRSLYIQVYIIAVLVFLFEEPYFSANIGYMFLVNISGAVIIITTITINIIM